MNDTQLVIAAIGRCLGLKPSGKQPVAEAVAGHLRDKQLLLVLDNFEQVLDAGPEVLQLLSACPGLKVLVTSREPLHAYGECRFQVPPLELPDHKRLPDPDALGRPGFGRPLYAARPSAQTGLGPHPGLTLEPSRPFASIWTGCPWPSSWPPHRLRTSRRNRSWLAWGIGSNSYGPTCAIFRPASRPYAGRLIGAISSWPREKELFCAGWVYSPADSAWPPYRQSAMPTTTCRLRHKRALRL